jgi:hypothetical protein
MVLRSTFGLKRVELIRGWRKLHNEELHKLYSSPSTIRMIRLRETLIGYWWENQKEIDHYKDPDIDGRIIIK